MSARIFLSFFIFFMSVIPNACLVEQVVASIAETISHGYHGKAQHHEQAAPSHSHDEEGHEENFCCDNESYQYIGANKMVDFQEHQSTVFLYFQLDASQGKSSYQVHVDLHRLKQPTAMRSRDKYALTSLLHAPPYL